MTTEGLIITKFGRDEDGILTARVSTNGTTVPVTRRFGSWTTVPDDRGACRDVHRSIAAALQRRARRLERDELREVLDAVEQDLRVMKRRKEPKRPRAREEYLGDVERLESRVKQMKDQIARRSS